MKKIIIALCMVMGLFMVSCQSEPDMKSIVEKAKTEGANWTEDQWKDAFKGMLKCVKPMFEDMQNLQKEIKAKSNAEELSDAERIALLDEVVKKSKELEEKYKEEAKLMQEFDEAAKKTEIGNKVSNDKEFEKECMKELGIEEEL